MKTVAPKLDPAELKRLHEAASGGTWKSDLHGLYITSDKCPLCTEKRGKNELIDRMRKAKP